MTDVWLGLGSNMGDRLASLKFSVQSLRRSKDTSLVSVSSVYETEPVGFCNQAWFYNAVVHVRTQVSPEALLAVCMDIEQQAGRVRLVRWGPRSLDLDILVFGTQIIDQPNLVIPHPRLAERLFVLAPLSELNPDLHIPSLGIVSHLYSHPLPSQAGVRLTLAASSKWWE